MCNQWAAEEFERSEFYDGRIRKSIIRAAELVAVNQGASHSVAVGNGLRQATSSAFGSENIDTEIILGGHKLATLDRCREHKIVLALHDSTSFNYSGHLAAGDLGLVNGRKEARGIHAHSSLAASEAGVPFGLVSVHFWTRDPASVRTLTEGQITALPIEEKESYKWLRSASQTAEALKPFLDEGGQVILVGDRESDVIELFSQKRHPNFHLLVRSRHPRRIEAGLEKLSLPVFLSRIAECGEYTITVGRQLGHAERQAKMGVRFASVILTPTDNKKAGAQQVWVVQASEKDAPAGITPLSWTLLITKEVSDFEQARRVVEWYSRRWTIERLHYTLKAGCFHVERLQFDDFHTLTNALAFYYIVAWQVLWLMYWSRERPDAPAVEFFNEDELQMLQRMSRKPVKTMKQALIAVAELGGYVYYPKAGPPGVKLLCAGQRRLNDMVQAVALYRKTTEEI